MTYKFSEEAILKAKELLATQTNSNAAFRLYIEGKECDGFVYGICFDEKTDKDLEFSFDSIRLIVDKQTHTFTDNMNIDWHCIDNQEGFKLENPSESKYRGKFFKRKAWQDLLTTPDFIN